MAKIVLSDTAPKGHKRFTLGAEEVEVPFETNDTDILSNASVHPWLVVEGPEGADAPPSYVTTLPRDADALSAINSIANDPKEVEKALKAREAAAVARVAIDADLDQKKKVETGGVAETVAAADAQTPTTEPRPTEGDAPAPKPKQEKN
jgi:hypothetical protein